MSTTSARAPRRRRIASDEAHAWARNLRLGNPYAKSVLRALAGYTNEFAVCNPGISTIADDTDLSEDTVRKRLRFLEDVGAIARFAQWRDEVGRLNKEGRGKRTTDEIRLLVDSDAEQIAARAAGEEIAGDEADTSFSPRCQQGLNPEETNRSPAPALRQPLQCSEGLISEPEPEDSPQAPLAGGGVSDDQDVKQSEPEHFAEFKLQYPSADLWNWAKVEPVFRALTTAEAEHARAAIPLYAAQVQPKAPRGPKPMRPDRWLRERLFTNFPEAKLPEKPKPLIFVAKGSAEHRAMGVLAIILNKSWPEIRVIEGHGEGLFRQGEVPPDYAALSQFADKPIGEWQLAEPNSKNFFAWSKRIQEWTGQRVEPQLVMLEGTTTIKFNGKEFEAQKRAHGLRIPWPWPPRKDGTLSPELETEGASQ